MAQLPPCLDLQHLKTSKQYKGATLINRYWFQWKDRRNLSNLVVRLDLLNAAGEVITNASLQLPKVKITRKLDDGTPVYDGTVFLNVDDVARPEAPVSFQFYTVEGLLKKSKLAAGLMAGPYEDLSMHR